MANIQHKLLATTDLHVPGYMGTDDPADTYTMTAGMYWVDTTLGEGNWVVKVWNADTSAWESTKADAISIHILPTKTPPVGADVLVIEDSASSWDKKKITVSSLIGTISDVGKVKASASDPTAGYLDDKVNGTSIQVSNQKIILDTALYNHLKSTQVGYLIEPGMHGTANGCIMKNGTIRLWSNTITYAGIGSTGLSLLPCPAAIPIGAEILFTKLYQACQNFYAISSTGDVYAVGSNNVGQLCNGGITSTFVFSKIGGLSNVVKLALQHSDGINTTAYALTSSGDLFSWGHNLVDGAVGRGDLVSPQTTPWPLGGTWSDVVTAGSGNHAITYGLRTNGEVYAWGYNGTGACGQNNITTPVMTPTRIPSLVGTVITQIYATGYGTELSGFFVDNNHNCYAVGSNTYKQLCQGAVVTPVLTPTLINASMSGVVDRLYMSGGNTPSVYAVRTDSSLWTWGANANYQLMNGNATDQGTPQQITNVTNVIKCVPLGGTTSGGWAVLHSLDAEDTRRKISCAGYNLQGQLGDGTIVNSAQTYACGPTTGKIMDISCTGTLTTAVLMALFDNGNMYATGNNSNGQIGNGTTTDRCSLSKVIF